MMFIAVDLPEPLGPMMATNSPSSTRRSTPASAFTAASPLPIDAGHAGEFDERRRPVSVSAIAGLYFAVRRSR